MFAYNVSCAQSYGPNGKKESSKHAHTQEKKMTFEPSPVTNNVVTGGDGSAPL